jgi:hypothetical protein
VLLLVCITGLLPAVPTILRALLAQEAQRQQQQQTGDWRLFVGMLDFLRSVVHTWHSMVSENPAMLRTILPAVLALLQHVQACGPLQPAAPTSTAASVYATGSNSEDASSSGPHEALFQLQFNALLVFYELAMQIDREELGCGSMLQLEPACKLLRDPAALELLLQLLAAHISMLHKAHVTYRQQQLQGFSATPCASSSSSSHGSGSSGSCPRQVCTPAARGIKRTQAAAACRPAAHPCLPPASGHAAAAARWPGLPRCSSSSEKQSSSSRWRWLRDRTTAALAISDAYVLAGDDKQLGLPP